MAVCNKDRRERENTEKCCLSVSLSVFMISNVTTVEKGKKTYAVIYYGLIVDLENFPWGQAGPGEGGGGAGCSGCRGVYSQCEDEGRREERGEEKRMTGQGDDLWIISLLSLHLCVCGCDYKSSVRLADTLPRLSHHVLLLILPAYKPYLISTISCDCLGNVSWEIHKYFTSHKTSVTLHKL